MTRANHEPWPKDSFIADLPDAERAKLLAAGEQQRFADEAILLVQGAPGDFVYVLVSGFVKVIFDAENGKRTTLALRSRGDLIGEFALLDDKPRTATACAAGPVTALKIGRAAFMEVTNQSLAAQGAVTRYILSKMRASTDRRAADRVWGAPERLVQVLYELAERHGEPGPEGTLRLPVTQGDLADLAGVAVSTAERVLKDLRRQEVVATKYREITIKNKSYLASIRFPPEKPEKPEKPLRAGICRAPVR